MYIKIYARNRGVFWWHPLPFWKGGGDVVCIGTTDVVVGPMEEVGVSNVAPSLRRSIGGTGA